MYIELCVYKEGDDTGADLSLLVGVSVSRSRVSFYLRTAGGGRHVSFNLQKG